jgi:AraC-like DNA-binding protein/ligand-binding sensor protein
MLIESLAPAASPNPSREDQELFVQLEKSEIFREYQKAFEAATGLPLAIRSTGSFQPPLRGSRHANAFCSLMAGRNKTCSACLQLQQRIENEATNAAVTLECFAGLSDSAVPVCVGSRVVAYLQTGQVLHQPPSEAQFRTLSRRLGEMGVNSGLGRFKKAYFGTRVIARQQYDSILHMLTIFAQHLSTVSNQIMVKAAAAEAPAAAKARSFIASHQGEELSLSQVARAVNMSAFYFCKVFKKATGLTFTEYLARVRIERVKDSLMNPHCRVSEAAYEAGFQSLSQFNRMFRRIAGESPSDYRERLHGSPAGTLTVTAA